MHEKPPQRYNRPLVNLSARVKSNNLLHFVAPLEIEITKPDPGYLPVSLTPFIGRQAEVELVSHLISNPTVHLLTLYGTGKTRLSLAVAEQLKSQFQDGVFFVNLAPLSKPELGLAAIAQVLGLQDHNQLPLLKKLQNYLQKRQLLLILDNFEQIVTLGVAISELLQAAPRLKVLVTSRMVLHLYGENVYNVATLNLPGLTEETSFETLSQNEAVRLFVQHASMVNSEFILTEANVRLVAALCVHLEGLPLAIELAAARCNVFSPEMLWDRLAQAANTRFEILNAGFANRPSRHQSLAEAIDWSYQLLSEPEKQLFSRLGIFVDSFSLSAAEATGPDSAATLETVISLLDKSLLKQVEALPGEELRFTMLETLREYALEKLAETGRLALARTAHSRYFIEMVETGAEQLKTPDQLSWLKRLTADHPNILSALDYLIENDQVDGAFRLGGSIWVIWWRWGYLNQGRQWLYKILALDRPEIAKVWRARVLDGMAYLAMYQSDYRTAQTYFERSLEIWREIGVSKYLSRAISGLAGNYRILGNYERALQLNYESLDLFRLLGEAVSEADSLANIAWQLMERGNYEPVQPMLQEALEIHTRVNYLSGIARTKIYLGDFYWRKNDPAEAIRNLEEAIATLRQVNHRIQLPAGLARLGLIYLCQGQPALAEKLLEENVEISEEMNKTLDLTYAYSNLGLLRMVQNNLAEAETLFQQTLNLRSEIGQLEGVLWGLEGLAVLTLKQARYAEAQEMLEEAHNLRQAIDAPVLPHTLKFILPKLLNFQTSDSLVPSDRLKSKPPAANRHRTVDSGASPASSGASSDSSNVDEQLGSLGLEASVELTGREREVLKLLAQGHSNIQIARILVISSGTVNNHLSSIYSKLGVNSRTAAVRYALDYSLL